MKYSTKTVFRIAAFAGFLFLLSSCSQKLRFNRSVVVPAAEGAVKIKKDDNNNYSINVKVKNLADPDKLQPPRKTYIVWMETERNVFKNLGMLKNSGGLFSKGLKASLSTVTSFEPRRIFLTAEDDGNKNYPYGETILTTNSF